MTDLTAEWCLYRASLSETYAEYLIRRDRLDVAKFHRKSAIIYRIAARVLDEDAEKRLAEEMGRVIWGGHEPSGWKSFIGEARITIAYLKG